MTTEAIVLCGEWSRIHNRGSQQELNDLVHRATELVNEIPDGIREIYGDFQDGYGAQEYNGGMYFGAWLCGFPNGKGTLIYEDGSTVHGEWSRGELRMRL